LRYKEKFTAKVINAGEKWIVGRKDGDVLPGGYNGFAGVDCSGFITKLWHYGGEYEHLGTGLIGDYAITTDGNKLREGDFLLKSGHVVLFKNWIQAYTKIGIIHAVSNSFESNFKTHVRKIIEDSTDAERELGTVLN